MLMSGGLGITFPSAINTVITNTTPIPISGTVITSIPQVSTLAEVVLPVTAVSQGMGTIPANTKGVQIQYLSSNGNDRLYTKTDGTPVTVSDAQTTALQVITLESMNDAQNFRFIGTIGTTIKVVFRG